jgi:aconitate hydratase
LKGTEKFDINLRGGNLKVGEWIKVKDENGKEFDAKVRLDTDVEIEYFKNGGILQYVLRKLNRG